MEQAKTPKCVACRAGGPEGVVPFEVTVGTLTFAATAPGWRCAACGATYVGTEHVARFEREVAARVARARRPDDAALAGAALRFLRKVVGLTAKATAEALGVTPETVSRWETGDRAVPQMAWALVAMMVEDRAAQGWRRADPATLVRLRASLDAAPLAGSAA